ncbi:hypothetical protein [Brachybacterium paraconglomeratum]|uniref:hypothetical protein n=1 Tax=Brachybacterium paraconglomeratum TaxID=173362 RepID=UPI0022AEBDA3|nr:hypothetical protein [Brachybacterium paraconglomeratum]MCZ4326762.1 hypothetical protein [Brachybacterium paraconglomeratum]
MSVAPTFDESAHPREDSGRFAPHPYDRADVDLPQYPEGVTGSDFVAFELSDDPYGMPDEEYNRGGTYDYPPVPRSAEQVRKFWASVQIPDVAIRHYEKTYAADVEASVQAHLQSWDSTHPEPRTGIGFEKQHAAWEAERAAAEKEFRAERSPEIYRPYLRTAVRVMKMIEDGRYLESQEERDRLKASQVTYSPTSDPSTVANLDSWMGIRSRALRDRALATSGEIEASTQDSLRGEMSRAIAQLSQQIQQVQQTADGTFNGLVNVFSEEDRRAGRHR